MMSGMLRWMWIAMLCVTWVTAEAGSGPARAADIARMSASQSVLAAGRGEVLFVDVRLPGQRGLGHIRGDVHVPVDQVAARAAELRGNRRLVFYCSCPAEDLALEAARALLQAGPADVAVLVGGFDAWREAGGGVVVPSTWEEIFHITEPPSGWGKTPVDSTRCRYARDRRVAAQGDASACVSCRADSVTRGLAGFSQRLDARPLFGRTVKLTAIVRSEDVRQAAYLWVGVEDPEGRMIAWVRSQDDPIHGTQDWHPIEVSGIVPRDVGKVVIGLSLEASGRVWLDDVHFVAPAERGLPALSIAIANPSFED
jgi:rhodanese-related sulfurtransferase